MTKQNFINKKDKENISKLLNENGLLLKYFSKEISEDKELALIAVKNDGEAFKYVSKIYN